MTLPVSLNPAYRHPGPILNLSWIHVNDDLVHDTLMLGNDKGNTSKNQRHILLTLTQQHTEAPYHLGSGFLILVSK